MELLVCANVGLTALFISIISHNPYDYPNEIGFRGCAFVLVKIFA